MSPYLSPFQLVQPSLPAHCEPANWLLRDFSATFHTCVPTNLAFISSVLGTCSIVAWLFAQLPQIYKNNRLKSTSGLSIFFLAEWLLGDLSNLLGSIFTSQALWQVIIAAYYVTVDCALVGQWIWYEMLKHGRPLRPIWDSGDSLDGTDGDGGMQEVWDRLGPGDSKGSNGKPGAGPDGSIRTSPPRTPGQYIQRPNPMDAFRIPNFARSPGRARESSPPPGTPPTGTPSHPTIRRLASSPMPSPKTVLYISLILAVLSNSATAKPISPFAPAPYSISRRASASSFTTTSTHAHPSASEIAGKILSWMSTLLYLGSRLPQLYKNHTRRSTAGLSPTLFAAAFFGNLFYSTSLLTNPCAWYSYAPGEGSGWVGPQGSSRADWVLRATPFFLGAAGVLLMDAAVGFQFWYFGEGDATTAEEIRGRPLPRDDEIILVVNDHGIRKRIHRRWRRASGWMRGWMPTVSVAGTPSVSQASTPAQTPREASPSSSRSIPRSDRGTGRDTGGVYGSPWRNGGGALDEARALLGTSPRGSGYGAA
jgi:uncharacterized protein with PQ loop repeat